MKPIVIEPFWEPGTSSDSYKHHYVGRDLDFFFTPRHQTISPVLRIGTCVEMVGLNPVEEPWEGVVAGNYLIEYQPLASDYSYDFEYLVKFLSKEYRVLPWYRLNKINVNDELLTLREEVNREYTHRKLLGGNAYVPT